jgi:uncharacterized protein
MSGTSTVLDLGGLRLASGEGRRLELSVHVEPLTLGGERYEVWPYELAATLDVSRMVGHGYALRLRLQATLHGPCMRCLQDAQPSVSVDAREVDRPEAGRHAPSALADSGMRAKRVSPQSVPVSASRPSADCATL